MRPKTTTIKVGPREFPDVPAKWEVCHRCEGDGKVVHEALSVWTQSDRERDPDGFERMMEGDYDVMCPQCKGARLVLVPDTERADPEVLAEIEEAREQEFTYQQQRAQELRYGY